MFRKQVKKHHNAFAVHVFKPRDEVEGYEPHGSTTLANDNAHILQAETNRFGILDRVDNMTGDNMNDIITFDEPTESHDNQDDKSHRYLPGQRLLETIRSERPELLHTYTKITTQRKEKLTKLRDTLRSQ